MYVAPKVSICIPMHNTEKLLGRCLASVAGQNFEGLELVFINDCSTGKDENGWSCKKILRKFKKQSHIPVVYIEHNRYVPLLETRRELVENANGDYILMVDSDDYLADNAVKTLYNAAQESGAEIVCGTERVYHIKDNNIQLTQRQFAFHSAGLFHNREILDAWLVEKKTSTFLWAKLIKRELYLTAFNELPFMDCSFSVDMPIYFFIAYHAKSYLGINDIVYYYLENEGITSRKPITDLETWRRNCTAASTYSFILTFDGNLTEPEKKGIQRLSQVLLINSIFRLRNQVSPELQPDARQMLCDYWGESFVNRMEKYIEKSQPECYN